MYQGQHGGDCDECEVYRPERSEGGIHTSHIATMPLEVHTTFCVQIGGKSRVACECVVSHRQSSFVRYEHFARSSGRYEHYRPLKHAALRTSMQCDFFRPFGHKNYFKRPMYQVCYIITITKNMWIWKPLYEKSLTPPKGLTFRSDGFGLRILVSFSNAWQTNKRKRGLSTEKRREVSVETWTQIIF